MKVSKHTLLPNPPNEKPKNTWEPFVLSDKFVHKPLSQTLTQGSHRPRKYLLKPLLNQLKHMHSIRARDKEMSRKFFAGLAQ